MGVAPEFVKLVEEKNLIRARSYLANCMVVDRTYKMFDEAYAYAAARISILQEHDGTSLESDESRWTIDYLNEQLVTVVSNFSKERIEHIKAVIPVAFGEETASVTEPGSSHGDESATSHTGRTVISEYEDSSPVRKTIRDANHLNTSTSGTPSRTGRCVISETEISENSKTVTTSRPIREYSGFEPSARTGRHVVSETETEKKPEEDPISPAKAAGIDVGTVMIVGGVALTAVGIATVKPVVIGTGVAVTGFGIAVKVSNNRK